MSAAASAFVLAYVAVFCRVGACVMAMPGLSSQHVPVRARLYVAIGLSLVVAPLVYDRLDTLFRADAGSALLLILFGETMVGLATGLAARLFFLMLEMLANGIALAIGLTGVAGVAMEENAGEPALVTFIVAAATLLFFLSEQHHEVIRALAASYELVGPGTAIPPRFELSEAVDALASGSLLALRLSGPFLVTSILVNFAFGLANKMTPSIQIFFAAQPVLIGLGFLLMMAVARPYLAGFALGLSEFLSR